MKINYGKGFLLFYLVLVGCAGVPATSEQPASAGNSPPAPLPPPSLPVITHSFASPKLRPGETWRVYIKASDPYGEMEYIVSTIDQPGVGEYPISRSRVDSENSHELNGYIYLATSTFQRLNWVGLTLTIKIQETAGRYSKPVEFRLSFNDLYQQDPPPPGIFKDEDLGAILIRPHGLRESPFNHFPLGIP